MTLNMASQLAKKGYPVQSMRSNSTSGGAAPADNDKRHGNRLPRLLTSAVTLCAMSLPGLGCHNHDGTVQKEMTWTCPVIGVGRRLPREKDDHGMVTDAYKRASAVRFSFADHPKQNIDFYQPGLCEHLTAQGARTVPVVFVVTHSPSGTLLSYEATSVNGRELITALPVRSTLYVPYDKVEVLAADKASKIRFETDFNLVEEEPLLHTPAEQVLQ